LANSIRAEKATRKERILPLASGPLTYAAAAHRPRINMHQSGFWFQSPVRPIVNARQGAKMAAWG
jgi:hypothetical protein